MKKKRRIKKENKKDAEEVSNFGKEFVSFGNKRKVFWSITFATIFLSIIGTPIMIQNEEFLKRFMIIWILEVIYIGMWIKWGDKRNK